MLHLVRHGRSLPVPGVPAHEWELDPAGFDDVWALRETRRLPSPGAAAWFCSPEPKAVATAQLLTEGEVGVVDALREHERHSTDWHDDFADVVRRAFDRPDEPAHPGWEPLSVCRTRVVAAVSGILDVHAGEPVVLVGHGTAWTLLAAALTGTPPDLDRWTGLGMPDVIDVPLPQPGPDSATMGS